MALKSRLGSTSVMSIEIGQLYRDYDRMMERANHHAAMAHNYEHAARYRWLLSSPARRIRSDFSGKAVDCRGFILASRFHSLPLISNRVPVSFP
jgi:hypothetical protein